MIKLYNIPKQKKVRIAAEKVKIVPITIKMTNILTMPYADYTLGVYRQIRSVFDRLEYDVDQPVYFKIVLDVNDILEEDDLDTVWLCVTAALTQMMCTDEPRYKEPRLSARAGIVDLTYTNMMKLLNSKTRFNCFAIQLEYRNMKLKLAY